MSARLQKKLNDLNTSTKVIPVSQLAEHLESLEESLYDYVAPNNEDDVVTALIRFASRALAEGIDHAKP
jgi:hypothetical protein